MMKRKLFVYTSVLASVAILCLSVLANLVSLPFGPSASAASEKSVRQGLFYDAPGDGTSTSTTAGRAKVIILTRGRIRYLNDLKASGFSGKGLQYLLANEVIGPWTTPGSGCNSSSTPVNNNVAHGFGDFCKYIHPNESWFVHNSRGQRLTNKHSDGRYSYHMNPASSGWREFARNRIAADLHGSNKIGYDGIFLDNVALRTYKLRNQLSSSDGGVKEFGSDSSYRTAVLGYLSAVGEKVRWAGPLWANLIDDATVSAGDYRPFVDKLDGFMNEAWAVGYVGRSAPNATEWNSILSVAEYAVSKGKGVLTVVQGYKDDYARQRYGVASYLLVSNSSKTFFRYAHASSYRSWWQYDNYNVALGAPKGKRYQVGSTWRRDFECGYVTVDPANRSGKIVQSSCSTTTLVSQPTQGIALPGTIQAENYKAGGAGVGYKDTTSGNTGGAYRTDDVDIEKSSSASNGHNVGWFNSGEWLAYDVNAATSATYNFKVRVASAYSGTKQFRIEVDGANVTGSVSAPYTNGWQAWASVSKTISLKAGAHKIRLVSETGGFNFDAIEVTQASTSTMAAVADEQTATEPAPADSMLAAPATDAPVEAAPVEAAPVEAAPVEDPSQVPPPAEAGPPAELPAPAVEASPPAELPAPAVEAGPPAQAPAEVGPPAEAPAVAPINVEAAAPAP